MKHIIWALVAIGFGAAGYFLGGSHNASNEIETEATDDIASLLPDDMVAAIRDETKRETLLSIWEQISEQFGFASDEVLAASRLNLPEGIPVSPFDLMKPKDGVGWPSLGNVIGASAIEAAKEGWVVMNVWASWCAPCVAELPDIQAAANALSGEDIKLFTINADVTGKDSVESAKAILEQRSATGLPFIMAEDSDTIASFTNSIFDDPNSKSFPYTVIYAPGGTPFAVFSGGAVSDEAIWAGETGLDFFRGLAAFTPE